MITHNNICSSLAATGSALFEGIPAGGERVAFLPLCHIAERLIGEYISIHRGETINFVENPETVFENLREVQPMVFFAVPRVWEKVFSTVAITIREAGKLQQHVLEGYKVADAMAAIGAGGSTFSDWWASR